MSNREQAAVRRPDPVPFQLVCTPAVPELLRRLECSLAVSTYQAGKVVFISASSDERLVQLPRSFQRPMAMNLFGDSLALSTGTTVELFGQDSRMAAGYPPQKDTYDALYLPRLTYQTGHIDTHSIDWDDQGRMCIVNTRFGCLARLSSTYSFEPFWHPPFLTRIAAEDRCHLNGVAYQSGRPRFATCLAPSDEAGGWRKMLPNNGMLIDVESSETVVGDLPMPHSPLFVDGKLYLLYSATGELAVLEPGAVRPRVLQKIGGFVRGMAYYRSHLFIAFSKLRKNSSTFRDLPIADEATEAGLAIIHEPTAALVGRIVYQQSVDEIFDVVVLPDQMRPGIVGLDRPERGMAITSPESSWWVSKTHDGSSPSGENGSAPR